MAKKEDKEFTYNIDSYIGSIKESDKHDWVKAVLRIQWGDNPSTLDIRNVNMGQKRIGKGISLSNEEADRLVDILVENDYGSLEALEEAVKKKKSFFMISTEIDDMLMNENDMYTIDINIKD